jgi:hypothetical protein
MSSNKNEKQEPDMRRFSSYGPITPGLHYHAPRKELIDWAYTQLVGEEPAEGGHYITVWAPRQCGKTWIMQEVVQKGAGREKPFFFNENRCIIKKEVK